ncbi:disks large-associated protein 2-like isoform X5 [Brienomyrus brachyistius]|uniref:disks large-associated protein 2-like isoform X5 n=1 Tax=Brienomyrus brachyistius TaxID=42636 RepID=UPI0020B408C0|nr:disks large-associated protein 2-like isoform X5 [Brienomyrus brachyistius]
MSALKKVLPAILQKHCCILPDRNKGVKSLLVKLKSREIYSESQCTLCGDPEDQQYSWSPLRHFDEDSPSPPAGSMKGLSGGRVVTQTAPGHTCLLAECEHPQDLGLHHGPEPRPTYLLSPVDGCPTELRRCSPRSSVHSDCTAMPAGAPGDHVSSSTFPRMHYSSHYDGGGGTRDDGAVVPSHGSGKMNRIPANLLDQFEKQLPLHRDGFHTLQYQRASAAEQRGESPGRIRHLVHSVQKLFTKSHSLEGSSSKMNGSKGDGHHHDHHSHHHGSHHGHHKHGRRSKSKERRSDGKHRPGGGGWWSSDDNLDSDSTYRTPSVLSRHHANHAGHCYPEVGPGRFTELALKTSRSNNDVKCSACEGLTAAPEGRFMKRSSWSTLTVSQAKEAYRKSSLNLEKPMMPQDLKPSLRSCHYLQVPQDEWGGYPGAGKDEEIPCRRMRSGSYIKAMADDDSGESDGSPATSPQKSIRPDALVKAVVQRPLLDPQSLWPLDKKNGDVTNYITNFAADLSQNYHLQAARDLHHNLTLDATANYNSPKFRSRNQSYMRAVSTLSQASCVSQVSETEVNGQFESVCESVFSEVESQAMEALDLPGCFRTRSHSYLRAIQAGFSQDDDCLPSIASSTVTSTIRSTTDGYDMVEGTSLLNEDDLHDDELDSSSLYRELGRSCREDRGRHSPSSTLTAMSVPGMPSHSFRAVPLKSGSSRRAKAPKEPAGDVALPSLPWKEEITAMRCELAELHRDVCGELRTFNSNFSKFARCYNTWAPGDRVSVGTQAGPGGLVRQSTADASVSCRPEQLPPVDPSTPHSFWPMVTPRPGTPERAEPTYASPGRFLFSEDWDPDKRRAEWRSGRQRSASLEIWIRKCTRPPLAYISLSF